jgi:hypothetical protein
MPGEIGRARRKTHAGFVGLEHKDFHGQALADEVWRRSMNRMGLREWAA